MKHERTVSKTQEVSEVVSVECDFCGSHRPPFGRWPADRSTAKYEDGNYYREEADRLRLSRGTHFPEGGSGEAWDLDICPACFEQKILPLALEDRRAPRDWDW